KSASTPIDTEKPLLKDPDGEDVNDVTRLPALVDRKKVVITEATIRDALRLDDAEGIDCLPNKEIFTELARMGYEKPSTKLTFYKGFFSSQWKFLIYTILQCMSAKRTSWNEFSSSMTSAVICLSTGKGFSGVETPLFEGMLVEQKIEEAGDVDEHVEEVTAGDDAHGDDSAAHGEVPTVQPPSPQHQLQPQQVADFPMSLLQEEIDACAALTRRVEHLEYNKVAQALEITKLKRRVKKLEKRNKVIVLKLRRLQRVGTSQTVATSDDTMMDDESNQGRMITEMDKDDVVVLMDDKEEDKKVEEAKVDESSQEDETEPADVQEVLDVVTTTKLITEVVTATSETIIVASTIVPTAEPYVPAATTATLTTALVTVVAAPNKGKGILVKEPKPLKMKQQIEQDEQFARKLHAELNKDIDWDEAIDHVKLKAKKDTAVKRYQVINRKPQTEDQARKNMIMYLKNVAGFKLDYFKGMSYDDIRPIFEAKFNLNYPDFAEELLQRGLGAICTCSNLEESKNCTWSSKGQELEATGIMWCSYDNLYNHAADFVRGKEVPTLKIYSRPDVECCKTSSQGGE
nr:hypothetical protein [Tanacetum cinerariifolium]